METVPNNLVQLIEDNQLNELQQYLKNTPGAYLMDPIYFEIADAVTYSIKINN